MHIVYDIQQTLRRYSVLPCQLGPHAMGAEPLSLPRLRSLSLSLVTAYKRSRAEYVRDIYQHDFTHQIDQIYQCRYSPDLDDLYDLHDLAHVAGWEPFNLHDLSINGTCKQIIRIPVHIYI